MPFTAQVYRIFIASPSDVAQEREDVRGVIADWNAVHAGHRGIVLLPVGWETHAVPQMGIRPQEHINESVLKDCDLLVGVFWSRMGTDAGSGMTGTEEEIRNHLLSGKKAHLYFSARALPHGVDTDQLDRVRAFKAEIQKTKSGLYGEFSSSEAFRKLFRDHLDMIMNGLPEEDGGNKGATGVKRSPKVKEKRSSEAQRSHLAGDEVTKVKYSARSFRMRSSESNRMTAEMSWDEMFKVIGPMMVKAELNSTLKQAVEAHLIDRLAESGETTQYDTKYTHAELPESEFSRIMFQFQELGYIQQDLVSSTITKTGTEKVRALLTRSHA